MKEENTKLTDELKAITDMLLRLLEKITTFWRTSEQAEELPKWRLNSSIK